MNLRAGLLGAFGWSIFAAGFAVVVWAADRDPHRLGDVVLTITVGPQLRLLVENAVRASTSTGSSGKVLDPYRWLRAAMSAACQDFGRYQSTFAQGIRFGDLDHPERLSAAIAHADAEILVDRLPQGVDTQLGRAFGGIDLSEGQWQKPALAHSVDAAGPAARQRFDVRRALLVAADRLLPALREGRQRLWIRATVVALQ